MSIAHINLTPNGEWGEGRIVKRSGAVGCALATKGALEDGEQLVGVMEGAARSGEPASVTMLGHTFARAGAVITPGVHHRLTTDAQGRVIPAMAGDQVVAFFTGVAAAEAGARVPVFVIAGASLPGAGGERFDVTVSAEDGDTRIVTLQALDAAGQPLAAERDVEVRLCTDFVTRLVDQMVAEVTPTVGSLVSGDFAGGLFRTNGAGQLALSVMEKNSADLTLYMDVINRHGGKSEWLTLTFAA
ncbi:hypothetical protein KKB55_11070 [Myxococcota bacterium]|nr:hypothetical protein [Myxococcota bacterium]MBU1898278.1 hypothetical protein [Myxococcota bacterium]